MARKLTAALAGWLFWLVYVFYAGISTVLKKYLDFSTNSARHNKWRDQHFFILIEYK